MGRIRAIFAGTSLLCAAWAGGIAQAATPSIAATDTTAAQTYLGDLDSMINRQRADSNAHFANEYAELFKSRRQWQQSYDLFAHAYDIADKNPKGPDAKVAARALRGMGFNKIELGQFDEAQKLFQQSLSFDPNNEVAINELKYIARKVATRVAVSPNTADLISAITKSDTWPY